MSRTHSKTTRLNGRKTLQTLGNVIFYVIVALLIALIVYGVIIQISHHL